MRILDQVILKADAASAFSVKARAYEVIFNQSRDSEERELLASQFERALLDGRQHGDARSSAMLGDALWHGKIVEQDREIAKECWLQAAESGHPKMGGLLHIAVGVVSPRSLNAPWMKNPDADAHACLKYTLATVASKRESQCRLGLFYYLRPVMSREEHVQIWAVEPNDSKAAEKFFQAVRQGCRPAQLLISEMLIWDRASVPEDADELVVRGGSALEEDDAAVELQRQDLEESDSADLEPLAMERIPPIVATPPNVGSAGSNEAGSSRRRQQLLLAQALLQGVLPYPKNHPTAPGLLSLCARLLADLDAGGSGLPTTDDARVMNPPARPRSSTSGSARQRNRRKRRLEGMSTSL